MQRGNGEVEVKTVQNALTEFGLIQRTLFVIGQAPYEVELHFLVTAAQPLAAKDGSNAT